MTTTRETCTFCDLIRGAGEVSVCYEDGAAVAFMDIQPVNAGHVLVVPREHYDSLFDVPPELGDHLFHVTMRLVGAVRRVTGCEDLNIVVSSGAAAGQDVFHHHVHIIPRREGDGFEVQLPFGGSDMPDRTMLDAIAARIISAMGDPMRTSRGGAGGTRASDGSRREAASAEADRPAAASTGPRASDREVALVYAHEGPADLRAEASGSDAEGGAGLYEQEGPHGELVRRESAA
jgi:histidine triad (HIT) family protein